MNGCWLYRAGEIERISVRHEGKPEACRFPRACPMLSSALQQRACGSFFYVDLPGGSSTFDVHVWYAWTRRTEQALNKE